MIATRIKHALPILAVSALVLAGLAHGPIGQLANYHDFADHTVLFGIPHACDVLSNLGFALVALWGLHRLGHQPPGHGYAGYRLFLFGLLLTAFGSTYYHLAPDNARLVWDRIPIALACAGLVAAVRGEALGRDSTPAAALLALYAVGSVAWWHFTELAGAGDLRPYLLLQLAPMVMLPLWQWLGDAPKRQRRAVAAALITYAIAKWTEINDHAIAEAIREVVPVTGHTLKHVLAIAAAAILVGRLIGPTNSASRQQTMRGKTALA